VHTALNDRNINLSKVMIYKHVLPLGLAEGFTSVCKDGVILRQPVHSTSAVCLGQIKLDVWFRLKRRVGRSVSVFPFLMLGDRLIDVSFGPIF